MRSKRAKERLFAATDWFEEVNMDLVYKSGAEEAIYLAEQDAEERAKYALKYALKFMTRLTESQKDAIAMHFEDALNNGGQSDENN